MSNDTVADTPEYVHYAVGIGYMMTAIIIIPLHIIVSYLMWHDKEMRNPTYQFIINLSITDVFELSAIAFYAGVVITFRLPRVLLLDRIMAFYLLASWYVGCVLFSFIGFSRWISMTRHHLTSYIFTKRTLLIMHILPWVFFFSWYLYNMVLHPTPLFLLYPELFTWGFTVTDPYGLYLEWHNFTFNQLCAVVEMVFNVMSLKWVHDTRMTIMSASIASNENRRRETKLLIQCFVIGCVFTFANFVYTIVFTAGYGGPMACLIVQISWTLNHCVNPLVYLSVNKKLRKAFIKLLRLDKCFCISKNKVTTTASISGANVGQGTVDGSVAKKNGSIVGLGSTGSEVPGQEMK